jgi:hypothetical protein
LSLTQKLGKKGCFAKVSYWTWFVVDTHPAFFYISKVMRLLSREKRVQRFCFKIRKEEKAQWISKD